MTDTLSTSLNKAAVLLMDYQPTILGNIADAPAMIGRAASVLAAARARKLPVVYIMVGFRPGYPEVNDRNPMFSGIKNAGRLLLEDSGTQIHEAVAPQAGEVVIVKPRVNAFHGTPLETILRATGIDTLILMGISSSGVILSTVRHAADADYRLIVLKDCCADSDADNHKFLMEKILPRQASVIASADMLQALSAAAK